jgi:hypothetical protein
MADKHTPGPWKIGTPPPNGEQTVGTDQGLMVAVATTGAGVQTKANASLIAAAPDLLDVLEELVAEFGVCGLTEKARAAIAKATGVQS